MIWSARSLSLARCVCTGRVGANAFSTVHKTPRISADALFGFASVYAALSAQRRSFDALYIVKAAGLADRQAEIIRLAEQLKVPIHEISRISMAQTLQRKGDQGVLLSCGELRPKRIKRIERAGGAPLWLAMEDVHDPMNLGAVIRSCFYLGVQGLILTNHSCSLTPTVSRASSGALEFFPIFTTDNLGRFLEAQTHFTRVALSPPTQTTTDDASFESVATATAAQPTLLVLGSEGAGLSAQASAQCDAHVSLKPHGALQDTLSRAHVDSLNVSVAAAISIDRFMRVRK